MRSRSLPVRRTPGASRRHPPRTRTGASSRCGPRRLKIISRRHPRVRIPHGTRGAWWRRARGRRGRRAADQRLNRTLAVNDVRAVEQGSVPHAAGSAPGGGRRAPEGCECCPVVAHPCCRVLAPDLCAFCAGAFYLLSACRLPASPGAHTTTSARAGVVDTTLGVATALDLASAVHPVLAHGAACPRVGALAWLRARYSASTRRPAASPECSCFAVAMLAWSLRNLLCLSVLGNLTTVSRTSIGTTRPAAPPAALQA